MSKTDKKTAKEYDFRSFIENMKDEDTSIVADGLTSAESAGTIDTGCYMLNAILSGSIFGGLPDNKRLQLAGESSTGKTFFALSIVKAFLDQNPGAGVIYYDTESAVTKDMMESRGIDSRRVAVVEKNTIEEFRTHALKAANSLIDVPEEKRPKMMFVLDSLGNLSSKKEMTDVAAGADTRDMTKAQLLRATFRVLTLKLAKAKIPLIVNNHTYDVVGQYIPTKKESGGGGARFASDIILFLGKKADRGSASDPKKIIGNILKVKADKSRFVQEKSTVELKLSFSTGLDKYYGLLDLAVEGGIIKKLATQYELPDGSKRFEKWINSNAATVFNDELLQKLDVIAREKFCYGSGLASTESEEDDIEYDPGEED